MLGMATTMDAATTGVREIAEALGGGIREGSLVLIEGEAKTGKSILSQHMAHAVLCSKESAVAYYTTDNIPEELIARMASLSLYVRQDFVTDRLRIHTLDSGNNFKNIQKYLQLLTNHISDLPGRFKLVVVDSVTPFLTYANPMTTVDFLQTCKELCEHDRSIILVVDTHVFEGKTISRAYAISDYYLRLRSKDMMLDSGQVDTRMIKILEVTKLAGVERQAQDDIMFEIKPKVGIQILPFVRIRV